MNIAGVSSKGEGVSRVGEFFWISCRGGESGGEPGCWFCCPLLSELVGVSSNGSRESAEVALESSLMTDCLFSHLLAAFWLCL